jgi:hypothetical protein
MKTNAVLAAASLAALAFTATIARAAEPAVHGMIGNVWLDRLTEGNQ